MLTTTQIVRFIGSHDVADVRPLADGRIRIASFATIQEPCDLEPRQFTAIDYVRDLNGARDVLGY